MTTRREVLQLGVADAFGAVSAFGMAMTCGMAGMSAADDTTATIWWWTPPHEFISAGVPARVCGGNLT